MCSTLVNCDRKFKFSVVFRQRGTDEYEDFFQREKK